CDLAGECLRLALRRHGIAIRVRELEPPILPRGSKGDSRVLLLGVVRKELAGEGGVVILPKAERYSEAADLDERVLGQIVEEGVELTGDIGRREVSGRIIDGNSVAPDDGQMLERRDREPHVRLHRKERPRVAAILEIVR